MTTLRITGILYKQLLEDLRRPHEFAAERVGFLFLSPCKLPNEELLLLSTEFMSIRDEDYIDDLTVGARINSNAIRNAMQRILDTQRGCFHVHHHAHSGKPHFSRTDVADFQALIPSFQSADKTNCHGAIVFSDDSARGILLPPKKTSFEDSVKIVIVDSPLRIL